MLFEVDFNSEIPIYLQIRNGIIKAIANGELKEGDKLPTIRNMASILDVNLHTINKAYNLLKDEGYLLVDRRRGVVVKVLKEADFIEKFKKNIDIVLQEGVVKGITRDEVIDIVKTMYTN